MGERTRVLVVDDDARVLGFVARRFAQLGWDAVPAADAAEALSRAADGGLDAILCDVRLGDADGIVLFGEFQRLCPGVPVVFMTGNAHSDTAMRALQSGAAGLLPKPFHLSALDEAIRRALTKRAAPEASAPAWEAPEESAVRRALSTVSGVLGTSPGTCALPAADAGLVTLVDAVCRRMDTPAAESRAARWAARLASADEATLAAVEAAGAAARAVRERRADWADGGGRASDGGAIPFAARCLRVASLAIDAVDSSRGRPADDVRDSLRMAAGTECDPVIVDACLALPEATFAALARRTSAAVPPVVTTPRDSA